MVSAVGVTGSLSAVVFAPLQPPEALQLLASVEDQLSVEETPKVTEVGKAESVTVGTGMPLVTVTVALSKAVPLLLLHVRV